MQTKQLNLRLTPDELTELNEIAEKFGLPSSTLGVIFMRAVLRSVKDHAGGVRLPIDFKIVEPSAALPRMSLNEPSPVKHRK